MNTMISCVIWSETSPTEVHGCCHCTWCCQPVPPPQLPPSSNFHLSPHIYIASHKHGLRCSLNFSRYWGSWELERSVHTLDGGKAELLIQLENILCALAARWQLTHKHQLGALRVQRSDTYSGWSSAVAYHVSLICHWSNTHHVLVHIHWLRNNIPTAAQTMF